MKKILVPVLFVYVLFSLPAAEWYRSNPGGLAMESLSSVLAQREDYALEVLDLDGIAVPAVLKPLVKDVSRIRGERLYHEKKVIMSRYKLYDSQNRLFAASQLADQGYSWIEQYDTKQQLLNEYWTIDSSTWFKREFTFVKDRIAESRTSMGDPNEAGTLLYTDLYRYDRTGFLRTIERLLADDAGTQHSIEWFSRNVESLTSLNRPGPGSSGTAPVAASLKDVSIVYSLDTKGRVIREQHKKADGSIVFEKTNTWEKDRLSTVFITEQNKTTRIEYSYDSQGNRTGETYYVGSDLVRRIVIEGNKEMEELYDMGKLILKTIYVDGVKQSEERPRRPAIKP
mgnify:CR=1 FL=1|uniref:Uncharacterized protein n=1 Tax=Gracilinema caldarium TaxID=215591 RepID=A0A7C3E2N8_9SPIR